MTLGRLASERALQGVRRGHRGACRSSAPRIPDVVYLSCGDGADRAAPGGESARTSECTDRVRFSGLRLRAEKADHYRLADVFVMPSRGEGFGFVLLEAMACGMPAVGSQIDGGREALRDGRSATLVDPRTTHGRCARRCFDALAAAPGRVPRA